MGEIYFGCLQDLWSLF